MLWLCSSSRFDMKEMFPLFWKSQFCKSLTKAYYLVKNPFQDNASNQNLKSLSPTVILNIKYNVNALLLSK